MNNALGSRQHMVALPTYQHSQIGHPGSQTHSFEQHQPLVHGDEFHTMQQYNPHHPQNQQRPVQRGQVSPHRQGQEDTGSVENVCSPGADEPEVRYVFVGHGKGAFGLAAYGAFHYVGPCQGDYEKEQLPPNRSRKFVTWCCICGALAAMAIAIVAVVQMLSPAGAFDCAAGLNEARGWSEMKKEYCCEKESVGCDQQLQPDFGNGFPPRHVNQGAMIPTWLNSWISPDLTLGAKFIVTGFLVAMLGCSCGCWGMNKYFLQVAPQRRDPTELELAAEIRKLQKRVGAKTGEITVTLMWDTKDDLDLHLILPNGLGEINCENPELEGGKLDIDGNHCLERATIKPIENITWPPHDATSRTNPPSGMYMVWVKVFQRHNRARDANITVVTHVAGQETMYHRRIVDGCHEVLICSFEYKAPAEPDRVR
mmetsp:Transcript_63496/g.182293  ORF Transcript_63496/g.182293 Transcript_63496/m.182293 type:complete len:425 (-) Transcript_63496:444-1718(-)